MPVAFWIGRLSQEFGGAMPSVILREIANAPDGLLEDIVEARDYVQAYLSVQAKDFPKGKEPPTPSLELLVREIESELAEEATEAHG